MQVVIFSSPQRKHMLKALRMELKGYDVSVINDKASFGKQNFWKRYKKAFEICKQSKHDNFMFLPDDICNLDLDTVEKLLELNRNKKFVCSVSSDGRRSCWGSKTDPKRYFRYNGYEFHCTGFFDCGGITNRKTLEGIDIDPVPSSWFDRPDKSSGVGYQLTNKFREAKVPMFTTYPSLSYHGDHDSVMHKKHRMMKPLISEPKQKPVVIGIATMNGRERFLEKTLESLEGQADEIIVCNNGEWGQGYTDNGKFLPLKDIKEETYFFCCDDDIIYPPTYVEDMIRGIDENNSIVTHHGRILKAKDSSYYRGHVQHHCKAMNPKECRLDVAGTGVTAFNTKYFHPKGLHLAKDKCMSDLVFSLEAAKQGKIIVNLKRPSGYFGIQDVPINETIYGKHVKDEKRQIQIANEIFELNYG